MTRIYDYDPPDPPHDPIYQGIYEEVEDMSLDAVYGALGERSRDVEGLSEGEAREVLLDVLYDEFMYS